MGTACGECPGNEHNPGLNLADTGHGLTLLPRMLRFLQFANFLFPCFSSSVKEG